MILWLFDSSFGEGAFFDGDRPKDRISKIILGNILSPKQDIVHEAKIAPGVLKPAALDQF